MDFKTVPYKFTKEDRELFIMHIPSKIINRINLGNNISSGYVYAPYVPMLDMSQLPFNVQPNNLGAGIVADRYSVSGIIHSVTGVVEF